MAANLVKKIVFGIEKNHLVSLTADVTVYSQVTNCEIAYTG